MTKQEDEKVRRLYPANVEGSKEFNQANERDRKMKKYIVTMVETSTGKHSGQAIGAESLTKVDEKMRRDFPGHEIVALKVLFPKKTRVEYVEYENSQNG